LRLSRPDLHQADLGNPPRRRTTRAPLCPALATGFTGLSTRWPATGCAGSWTAPLTPYQLV